MQLTTTTEDITPTDKAGFPVFVPAGTQVRVSVTPSGIRVRGQGWETRMTFLRASRVLACYPR